MDEMLGRPTVDPHGDPIPSARGVVKEREYPSLLACPTRSPLRVARVIDQETEFLRFLERHGVMPGNRIEVVSREKEAETVIVRPDHGKSFSMGFRAAAGILVEPLA
jgi:DtxR family Mn-dependent transcriptional regulator